MLTVRENLPVDIWAFSQVDVTNKKFTCCFSFCLMNSLGLNLRSQFDFPPLWRSQVKRVKELGCQWTQNSADCSADGKQRDSGHSAVSQFLQTVAGW